MKGDGTMSGALKKKMNYLGEATKKNSAKWPEFFFLCFISISPLLAALWKTQPRAQCRFFFSFSSEIFFSLDEKMRRAKDDLICAKIRFSLHRTIHERAEFPCFLGVPGISGNVADEKERRKNCEFSSFALSVCKWVQKKDEHLLFCARFVHNC